VCPYHNLKIPDFHLLSEKVDENLEFSTAWNWRENIEPICMSAGQG